MELFTVSPFALSWSKTHTLAAYTTDKLQPIVTDAAGKNLIRECLVRAVSK
jgi:hypothetical protein